ncbi:hypothetical protein DCE94_12930 [Agromyces badenianii]|nr:hypothetical protein DCE94_12930 [Agromyces badenianii]
MGAVGLWAITGSVFSLLFAAIGPLVAIASMVDGRRSARRLRRRAATERRQRLDDLAIEVGHRHEHERRSAWRRWPSPRLVLESDDHSAWRDGAPPPIVLGRGAVPSTMRVDGSPVDDADRELLLLATRLDAAPVLADAASGIGFVGELSLARAAARAAVVQLAYHASPQAFTIDGPGRCGDDPWGWLRALPHTDGPGRATMVVIDREVHGAGDRGESARRVGNRGDRGLSGRGAAGSPVPPSIQRGDSPIAVVAVAGDVAELPPGLETIVELDGPDIATLRRRGGADDSPLTPFLIGVAEASEWARSARLAAERSGLGGRSRALPQHVRVEELRQPVVAERDRSTLLAAVGLVDDGVLELDLARGGPHALVAGTTGSGKSEFLLAWMVALAAVYPPSLVSFLLIDFKGGAAFEPIRMLPHVTGIVTDLDEAEAERAVSSLRAELRYRETVLARAGARSIAELDHGVDLARLVIVIDEFQAMIERFPDFGAIIGDIAARGRSLGVHLVLASQRPNGVVREQVTANCATRVSLRVMRRSDSEAVVGSPSAAEIPPDSPGRGVVDRGDGIPVPFQSAIAGPASIAATAAAARGLAPARRPWLDPLPTPLTRAALAALAALVAEPTSPAPSLARERSTLETGEPAVTDDVVIGLLDEPELQRRSPAGWSPRRDGSLLVIGAQGSGRSNALAAVEEVSASMFGRGAVLRLEGRRSAIWDALVGAQAAVREATAPPRLIVVIDDLDTCFRAWPEEYRHAALEMVESLIREGRGQGVSVVASTTQLHGLGAGLRDGFGARLLLRHATRSDLVQSGGRGELWRAADAPGSGQWRDHRVQVVQAAGRIAAAQPAVPELELHPDRLYAIAAAAPRAAAAVVAALGRSPLLLTAGGEAVVRAALAAHPGDAPPVIVGDGEAWAASWGLVAQLREDAALVVHGGAAEYRALVRTRELPPLLDEGARQCWVVEPAAPVRRATWPKRLDD